MGTVQHVVEQCMTLSNKGCVELHELCCVNSVGLQELRELCELRSVVLILSCDPDRFFFK